MAELAIGFILFLVTFVIFVLIVMVVIRPILGPRRNVEPGCGKCGYAVRGLTTFECPECGADLREVGISSPHQRWRYGRGLITVPICIVWSIGCLVLGGVTYGLIEDLGHVNVNYTWHEWQFWGASLQDIGIHKMTIVGTAEAAGPVGATPPNPTLAKIKLRSKNGWLRQIDVKLDTLAYEVRPGTSGSVLSGEELDAATLAQWMCLSEDVSSTEAVEADAEVIVRNLGAIAAGMDPQWPYTSYGNEYTSGNRGEHRLDPQWGSVGWVAFWIAGIVWIVRRHDRRTAAAAS